jgi:hypothetical protein
MSSFTGQESSPLLGIQDGAKPWHRQPKNVLLIVGVSSCVVAIAVIICWQLGAFATSSSGDGGGESEVIKAIRYTINSDNALCNDGTRSSYFLRASTFGSKKWIIRTQSGGMCYNSASCADRWEDEGWRMTATSKSESDLDTNGGILNSKQEINPDFYDWNAVDISYCSSDMFTGNATIPNEDGWVFNGYNIVFGAYDDLYANHNLAEATDIMIIGEAVSTNVPFNLGNRIYSMARTYNPDVIFRGVIDAGWWINGTYPNTSTVCTTLNDCPTNLQFVYGLPMWQSVFDEDCVADGWGIQCFWAKTIYPYVLFPLIIEQTLFDISLLQAVGAPVDVTVEDDPVYWDYSLVLAQQYIDEWGDLGVSDYWAGSCSWAHGMETDSFTSTTVNGETMSDATRDWWQSTSSGSVRLIDSCFYSDCNPTC